MRIDATIGPKNIAVFTVTKNFPPVIANCVLLESEACFFSNQPLTFALVLVPAERKIASQDSGMVKATLIRVAFMMPNIFVVAIKDPSMITSPNIASNAPAAQAKALRIFLPSGLFIL